MRREGCDYERGSDQQKLGTRGDGEVVSAVARPARADPAADDASDEK
jgi:hypothetical protein